MGVYKKAIITEAGEALTARAVSGEATIQFSHTKTSAHTYPDGTNLKKLTYLQEVKQTVIPSNIQIANDTLIIIRSMFDNSEITQEYLIQNVGIYASDGETEILFAICQATAPDQMPAFNGVAPSSFIYNVQISIAQAEQLSISVNTAGAATAQDVLDLERKMEEKKLDSSGGDASNTVVSVEEPASSDDKYPEINGKGSIKSTLGKLYRWVNSLKADKVDSIGGDTADTLVSAFDASSDSFPVPVAKEKARTRWGKMKKFTEDFKNWMTGVCLIGQIVNNSVTDRADLPLSAAQGKVLMDLYTVLNTDFMDRFGIYAPLNNVPLNSNNPVIDFLVPITDYRYIIIGALIKDTQNNKQRVTETIPVDLIKLALNVEVFSVGKYLNQAYFACIEFNFPNTHTIKFLNAQCLGFASIWVDYIFGIK